MPASRKAILECGGLPPLCLRQEPQPPKTGRWDVRPVRRGQSGGKPPHSKIAQRSSPHPPVAHRLADGGHGEHSAGHDGRHARVPRAACCPCAVVLCSEDRYIIQQQCGGVEILDGPFDHAGIPGKGNGRPMELSPSKGAGVDLFTPITSQQGSERVWTDRGLNEPHGAVAEQHVHALGMAPVAWCRQTCENLVDREIAGFHPGKSTKSQAIREMSL